jgi:hypothetical protein
MIGGVQAKKAGVLGKDNAGFTCREGEVFRVCGREQAHFLHSDNIHAAPPQSFGHGAVNMLIEVKL